MEKPPILKGTEQQQLQALRDYLFRMADSLEAAGGADAGLQPITGSKGFELGGVRKQMPSQDEQLQQVRDNAQQLQALIVKSARELEEQIRSGDATVTAYADRKVEEYNSLYVAKSEFGTFEETITARIEATAKGVVESYGYESQIDSLQEGIDLAQKYYTAINGEIRRGIVQDPESGEYVTGIAISESLKFSGECGPGDSQNPGDGYTYYYLNAGQTFGLYTATGWQFWIDGYKKGWFDSRDGMLHVANVFVENILQVGEDWQIKSNASGSEFELLYVGSDA